MDSWREAWKGRAMVFIVPFIATVAIMNLLGMEGAGASLIGVVGILLLGVAILLWLSLFMTMNESDDMWNVGRVYMLICARNCGWMAGGSHWTSGWTDEKTE